MADHFAVEWVTTLHWNTQTVLVRRLERIWTLADDVQAKLKTVQQYLSADAVQDAWSAIADAQELAKRIEDEADTPVADPMAT